MFLERMYAEIQNKYLPLCSVSGYAVTRLYVQRIIIAYVRNKHKKLISLHLYIQLLNS